MTTLQLIIFQASYYTQRKDGDEKVISDFSIDFGNSGEQVRPGQSVPIKFEIVDGSGAQIPNVLAHIGICDESLDEAPSWVAVLPGTQVRYEKQRVLFWMHISSEKHNSCLGMACLILASKSQMMLQKENTA